MKTIKTGKKAGKKNTNHQHHQENHIAENLKSLLSHREITISELANKIEIPVMTIYRLLNGETKDPRLSTVRAIEGALEIPEGTLDSKLNVIPPKTKLRQINIPLFDWNADKVQQNHIISEGWHNWFSVTIDIDAYPQHTLFALPSKQNMYPRFPSQTTFIIGQDITPVNGDLILVSTNSSLMLYDYIDYGSKKLLKPINEQTLLIDYDPKIHNVCGVVIETLYMNRESNRK